MAGLSVHAVDLRVPSLAPGSSQLHVQILDGGVLDLHPHTLQYYQSTAQATLWPPPINFEEELFTTRVFVCFQRYLALYVLQNPTQPTESP